jgi:hypothetical protein
MALRRHRRAIMCTAALTNYLIERVVRRGKPAVDLCEAIGEHWVTIRRGISPKTARLMGFNLESPAVQKVFAGIID